MTKKEAMSKIKSLYHNAGTASSLKMLKQTYSKVKNLPITEDAELPEELNSEVASL